MLSYHITRINQNKPEWTTQVQRIEFDGQQKTNSPHLTKSNLWHPTPPPLAMCLSAARVAARRYAANHPHDQTKPRIPDRADEVIWRDFVSKRLEKIPVLPSGRFHMSSALTIEKNMEEVCTGSSALSSAGSSVFPTQNGRIASGGADFRIAKVDICKEFPIGTPKKVAARTTDLYTVSKSIQCWSDLWETWTRGDLNLVNLVIPPHLPRQNPSHPCVHNHNHDDLGSHRTT